MTPNYLELQESASFGRRMGHSLVIWVVPDQFNRVRTTTTTKSTQDFHIFNRLEMVGAHPIPWGPSTSRRGPYGK